jgi:hypothetical protein
LHANRNKREASSTVSNFKSSPSIANTNEALTVELNTRSAERKPNGQSICALINGRSVCNKTELLNEFLISNRVDPLLLLLLSIHNAAINAIDDGKIMLLVMLDLSAAFDMVNHSLLLKYCENMGIRDEALAWLEDYFSNRKQNVSCETVASTPTNLKTGVPQGSILGPLLFSVYISQIANVFEKYPEVRYVIYEDDIQFFSSCNVIDVKPTIRKFENCIHDVKIWLHQHRLILNLSKTDFIVFHSKRTSLQASGHSLVVDGVITNQKQVVRNLGVFLYDGLNMDQHVSTICKNATYQLRLISRSRHFLTRSTVAIIVHALAISRIEYCSSLLDEITSQLMRRIENVIHYGVRLVEGLK